jgi:GTP pyrophosphokinase
VTRSRPDGTDTESTDDSLLDRAFELARRLHAGQKRKGPDPTPYVAHLLGVCSLTLEAGGDEDQAVAALLHDAAEDQGGRDRLEEIRSRFGDRVADIVEACTDTFEDPKPEWCPRKDRYVSQLADESTDALLVACADKLYNARAILRDHRRVGDEVFERFTGGKDGTLWYYRSLVEAFRASELETWLVDELERTVTELSSAASED